MLPGRGKDGASFRAPSLGEERAMALNAPAENVISVQVRPIRTKTRARRLANMLANVAAPPDVGFAVVDACGTVGRSLVQRRPRPRGSVASPVARSRLGATVRVEYVALGDRRALRRIGGHFADVRSVVRTRGNVDRRRGWPHDPGRAAGSGGARSERAEQESRGKCHAHDSQHPRLHPDDPYSRSASRSRGTRRRGSPSVAPAVVIRRHSSGARVRSSYCFRRAGSPSTWKAAFKRLVLALRQDRSDSCRGGTWPPGSVGGSDRFVRRIGVTPKTA
jgi:hypothetical protein